jgi:TRAP-type C4-dicarboxylate transport system substrate-binding protein
MKITWGILEPLEEYKKIANKFNDQIKKITNNNLEVEIKFFDKDPENPLAEIEKRTIDIYQVPTTQLVGLLPKETWLKSWEVPFLFKNESHVESYILSKETKEKLKNLETEKLLPLTYSYAGGFCGVISRRSEGKTKDFSNLKTIDFSKHEYEDMSLDNFLVEVYQHLPSNILMYEINEMLKLKPEIKSLISIEDSKHLVVARVTMISKDMISKIPSEYKDSFLSTLNELLNEERQVIYERSRRNLEALKSDNHIGFNQYDLSNKDLNEEIKYINSLI